MVRSVPVQIETRLKPGLQRLSESLFAYLRLMANTQTDRGVSGFGGGGRDRDRTCDPYHVKVVLSR